MDSVLSDKKWWNVVLLLLVVPKIPKLKKSQDIDCFRQEQNTDPPALWSCTSATKTPVVLCLLRISHYNHGLQHMPTMHFSTFETTH